MTSSALKSSALKSSVFQSFKSCALLGLAAALLCGGRASADPYTYEVDNYTFSGGDPAHPVVDDLTFNSLLITETYADGFSQSSALGSLNTSDVSAFAPATVGAAGHGLLTSALLTGQLGIDTFPAAGILDVSTQFQPGGPVTDQYVFSRFSASLFGPASGGVSVGQFTLLNSGLPVSGPVEINLVPVPEASTTASLGLLAALGLGTLAAARRRRRAAARSAAA